MLQKGSIINIQAYKHNGALYRQWNGVKVIEVTDEEITLFMIKTKVAENRGQKWTVHEPMIWWMPRNKFFNTTGLIRKTGVHFYTNLSSPPLFEEETIKFIDYDLDIKAYPRQKAKVVDREEYKRNHQTYKYDKSLQNIIEKTTNEVLEMIEKKESFFNQEKVNALITSLVDQKNLPPEWIDILKL